MVPVSENSDPETYGDAEDKKAQLKAPKLNYDWPRFTVALHVNNNNAGDCTGGDKCRPVHFAVETLRFAHPRGIPDRCGYAWN